MGAWEQGAVSTRGAHVQSARTCTHANTRMHAACTTHTHTHAHTHTCTRAPCSICKQLAAARVVSRGAKAISLTKGMRVRAEGPQLISQMVSRILGIECCVLMGANIAGDIANEELSEVRVHVCVPCVCVAHACVPLCPECVRVSMEEDGASSQKVKALPRHLAQAVIAYSNRESGELWQQLFQRPYFAINLLADVPGAEMCGTVRCCAVMLCMGVGCCTGWGQCGRGTWGCSCMHRQQGICTGCIRLNS